MKGTPTRSVTSLSREAWGRADSLPSITQGPAMRARGFPAPISIPPTFTLLSDMVSRPEKCQVRATLILGTSLRAAWFNRAALMKPLNRGWQSVGRDLSSGWN